MAVDGNLLRQIAPHFVGDKAERQSAIIDDVGALLADTLQKFKINSNLRIAHFLAQTCEESDGYSTTIEYASGQEYEGRRDLGNTQPGDGPRYKGRGLIQLTGRDNYQSFGRIMGLDLVDNPDLAAQPGTALQIACEYWRERGLNAFADQDDIVTITRRINGGLNGLDDRRLYLARAKLALGMTISAASIGSAAPTLRIGDRGDQVVSLQSMLKGKGFAIGIDGAFGAATEAAVKQFQTSHGLEADGIVGPQTWNALVQPA